MDIWAINGNALAGKDTFCNKVTEILLRDSSNGPKPVVVLSTIDPVKEFYSRHLGWDGTKTPVHRKNLNNIKKAWIDACNGPFEWAKEQIEYYRYMGVKVVFIMVREYDEMKGIVSLGGRTIRIVRDGLGVPPVEQEFIDSHPKEYRYDITIINPTTEDTGIPILSGAAMAFTHFTDVPFPVIWNPVAHCMEVPDYPQEY